MSCASIARPILIGNDYIQHCGASHLFGSISQRYLFEQSLCAILMQEKAAVLPIWIDDPAFGIDDVPQEGRNLLSQYGLLLENLDATDICGMPLRIQRDHFRNVDKASGGELNAPPEQKIPELIRLWKLAAQNDLPLWLEDIKKLAEQEHPKQKPNHFFF